MAASLLCTLGLVSLFANVQLICGQGLKFMAIGDWGQLFPQQEEVAWAMAEWAEDNDPEFIVALGDNFYPNGVHGVNDPQWDLKWYNIYYNDSIKDLPWYITVGNHDYGDSYEEQWNQVEFGKIEPRWIFPHLWHSLRRQVGVEEVHFMFIDTEALRLQLHNYTEMMEWLEEELATSTAKWKIVAGHRHVYTAADIGPISNPNYEVLRPLMEQYNVDVYLCGHDHQLQHLSKIDNRDIDYIISGGGGSLIGSPIDQDVVQQLNTTYGVQVDNFHLAWGFVAFTITDTDMTIDFFNKNSEHLSTYTRQK